MDVHVHRSAVSDPMSLTRGGRRWGRVASGAAFSESPWLKAEALGRQSWPTNSFPVAGEHIRQKKNFLKLFSVSPDYV